MLLRRWGKTLGMSQCIFRQVSFFISLIFVISMKLTTEAPVAPPIPNPNFPDIIPLDRDVGFVDSGEYIKRLHTQFSTAPGTHTRITLAGIGGVGYGPVYHPLFVTASKVMIVKPGLQQRYATGLNHH